MPRSDLPSTATACRLPGPAGWPATRPASHELTAASRACAAGLEEPGVGAAPDGEVAQGPGDVAFPDADGGAVEDDGLAGVEPAQGGAVADLGGGQLRAVSRG